MCASAELPDEGPGIEDGVPTSVMGVAMAEAALAAVERAAATGCGVDPGIDRCAEPGGVERGVD